MNTPEQKPEPTEEEKRLAELERVAKAARLGGGDVCVLSFADEGKGPNIEDVAKTARDAGA